jgi:hypothetical protein
VRYAAARMSSQLNGSTNKFGWLQASATKDSSLSITSPKLATIRMCLAAGAIREKYL